LPVEIVGKDLERFCDAPDVLTFFGVHLLLIVEIGLCLFQIIRPFDDMTLKPAVAGG